MADGASWIIPRMRSADSDEALIARYAAGDVAAFDALYARHEAPLWRFLLRLCRDRATAEELTQETWFAVAREAPRFRADGRFMPWLYTIARNRVIDRHRQTRPLVSLDAAPAGADDDAPLLARLPDDTAATPEAGSAQLELGAALLAALQRLPDAQREVFLLQVEADLTVEDIATVTGTTFETAKSRLRYARDKLRVLLQEYAS